MPCSKPLPGPPSCFVLSLGGGRKAKGINYVRPSIEVLPDLILPSVTLMNPGTQNSFDGAVVNVLLMASNSAGNPLTFSQTNLPAGLSITNNLGVPAITGAIASNAHIYGPYSVIVTATDTVTSEYASQPFTWNVTYNAPTVWGNLIPLDVLRNNLTDPVDLAPYASGGNGNALQFSVTTQPSHGELNPLGGSFYVYMSNPAYTGQDSFSFQATDGYGVSNIASFTFNVTNTAPTAGSTGTYYVLKNRTLTISDLNTYGNSASTNSFTPVLVGQPLNGVAVSLGNGLFTYTPNTGYTGPDMFSYKVNDGITNSNNGSVNINVVDQPIVANDVRIPVSMLDSVVISPAALLANTQSTSSSPSWQVTSVSTPLLGQMTANGNGTWTYTPPANQVVGFKDSATVVITDGTNSATESVVLCAPDRPDPGRAQAINARVDNPVMNILFPAVALGNAPAAALTLASYNAMAAADQTSVNHSLAASINQGYVSGDSAAASTLASTIRQKGFAWLSNTITPRFDPNAPQQLIGYMVKFLQDPGPGLPAYAFANVGIPTPAQRGAFGFSGRAGVVVSTSLWYTVYEMAYVAVRQGSGRPVTFTTVGYFTQPVAGAADSLAALRTVAGGAPTGGQSLTLANTAQAALVAQLSNATAIKTAATLTTFTAAQQTTATANNIDRATCYAVIGYDAMANPARVRLQNPKFTGPIDPSLTLDEFRQLFGSLTTNA